MSKSKKQIRKNKKRKKKKTDQKTVTSFFISTRKQHHQVLPVVDKSVGNPIIDMEARKPIIIEADALLSKRKPDHKNYDLFPFCVTAHYKAYPGISNTDGGFSLFLTDSEEFHNQVNNWFAEFTKDLGKLHNRPVRIKRIDWKEEL